MSAARAAEEAQALAADPTASVWVSANAGSGKTYVLVRRILRCLLSGAPPQSILCLTYTKAAAAEMSNRLLAELARWTADAPEALSRRLRGLLGRDPSDAEATLARALFAQVLDAPGGLKIFTIHSFCDRVLRRFPLEAGLSPGFAVMDDEAAAAALREAAAEALNLASSGENPALSAAMETVAALVAEDGFMRLLRDALSRRRDIEAVLRRQSPEDDVEAYEAALGVALGLAPGETLAAVEAAMDDILTRGEIAEAAAVLLASSKKTDHDRGKDLAAAARCGAPMREALAPVFLTTEGEPRDRFITKEIAERRPDIAAMLTTARDAYARLETKALAAEAASATAALMRLAREAIARYQAAKSDAGAADYQDLIEKTLSLLGGRSASWVLYQLDSAVRHVLIDEAQDTNPDQWLIMRRLTEEFFAGEGAAEDARSVFAVGDEKQSIFGFQGAEPKRFRDAGAAYADEVRGAGGVWRDVSLSLSFRTVPAVLEAVDLTFRDASGLTAAGGAVAHAAHRTGQGGVVELWPTVKPGDRGGGDAFEPFDDEAAAQPPAERLADQIALQIRRWLDEGETLASAGRPVRAGDILILLRKREPFARAVIKACRERGVPVAGADRLRIATQLAVLDLLRLGDCLLQPADDLALAAALKSPLFDWSDEDLFRVGHGREGSLWDAIAGAAETDARCGAAMDRLRLWAGEAAAVPPFEFFSARLREDDARARFVAQLGPEAEDALDEFLGLALRYERSHAPTLAGFLHAMREAEAEVKRDLDSARDEVRVMTVHGAKGLEANIVFLADTCSTRGQRASDIVDIPDATAPPTEPPLLCWCVGGAKRLGPVKAARETMKEAEAAEYRRLLYVAMTRARDRLYVTGYDGARGRDAGCWYDLVAAGLTARAEPFETGHGPGLRLACAQTEPARADAAPPGLDAPLPPWAARPAAQDAPPMRLRPSAAVEHSAHTGGRVRDDAALQGVLVHALLQYLPSLDAGRWAEAAERYVEAEGAGLPPAVRRGLADEALRVLRAPDLAWLFAPETLAEAAFEARLTSPGGVCAQVSGQIDRIAPLGGELFIVDYKTGSPPGPGPEATPEAYVAQLAIYRAALEPQFPDRAVRTAILWTKSAALIRIPEAMLNAALSALWARGAALDGEKASS
ncbi:MAG: double-strand break repair helicase AddA [Hyphomicrobiales bacterium]|nr:double-strand break repair helicase AddA [Hyphomicrobiales bacterium]